MLIDETDLNNASLAVRRFWANSVIYGYREEFLDVEEKNARFDFLKKSTFC